ncbi:MAG: hypothetical protein HF982_01425 [Desulfobacteraceae bacterium]|nr:hypothetical protein [Desulfobacteraceae bacterium]MBC2718258.1 hypothetical protein [Desulfobacteraceae bacterium]
MLTVRNIKVVLVYIPVIDLLNDPERRQHDRIIQIIEEMAKDKEQICFVNYNTDYEARHDLFFDPRHLNEKGKQIVTGRLIENIKRMLTFDRALRALEAFIMPMQAKHSVAESFAKLE